MSKKNVEIWEEIRVALIIFLVVLSGLLFVTFLISICVNLFFYMLDL